MKWPNDKTAPGLAESAGDFILRAHREEFERGFRPEGPYELNAGANLLTVTSIQRSLGRTTLDMSTAENAGAEFMMTLSMINDGINPGSAWIREAVSKGWRARTGGGFFKKGEGNDQF